MPRALVPSWPPGVDWAGQKREVFVTHLQKVIRPPAFLRNLRLGNGEADEEQSCNEAAPTTSVTPSGSPRERAGGGGGRPVPRGAPGWKRALGGALHTDRLAPDAMGGSPECSAAGHRWLPVPVASYQWFSHSAVCQHYLGTYKTS